MPRADKTVSGRARHRSEPGFFKGGVCHRPFGAEKGLSCQKNKQDGFIVGRKSINENDSFFLVS